MAKNSCPIPDRLQRAGAHLPKLAILGSKYPRKYISSTIGPAMPFNTNNNTNVTMSAEWL